MSPHTHALLSQQGATAAAAAATTGQLYDYTGGLRTAALSAGQLGHGYEAATYPYAAAATATARYTPTPSAAAYASYQLTNLLTSGVTRVGSESESPGF